MDTYKCPGISLREKKKYLSEYKVRIGVKIVQTLVCSSLAFVKKIKFELNLLFIMFF